MRKFMILPVMVLAIGAMFGTSSIDYAAEYEEVTAENSLADDEPLRTLEDFQVAYSEKIKSNKEEIVDYLNSEKVEEIKEEVDGVNINVYVNKVENRQVKTYLLNAQYLNEEEENVETQKEIEYEQELERQRELEEQEQKEREAQEAREEALRQSVEYWDADFNGVIDFDKRSELVNIAGVALEDYNYVNYIIINESGWNYTSNNGYVSGLPQASVTHQLPSDYDTNPISQIEWANSYAISTYGSWSSAYSHWTAYGSW